MGIDPGESHWHADTDEPLDSRSVGEVLVSWAEATPAAPALWWHEDGVLRTATYVELAHLAEEMARRLAALCPSSARVAVAASASIDWLVLEYGASLAGNPLVPINPAFTDAEVAHILDAVEPAVVLADESFRGAPLLERVAALGEQHGVGLVHELRDWRAVRPADGPRPAIDPAAPFLVQFTSGTTGRPKGAVLCHRAALNCASLTMRRLGGTADDVWLNVMPMHHVGGSVSVTLAVLSVGASMVIVPQFEPGLVLELIERAKVTITGGVPTMFLTMLEHPAFPATDVSSLRFTQVGGSVVAPALIERVEHALDTTVCNAYGQSESPNASMTSPDDDVVTKAETVGTPLPHREVRIVDPDGATVPFGVPGELIMRSPMVMDGYVGVDAETAAATLRPDGWLYTGDVCSMDNRGNIRIHGRSREVIIRGGENIYPAEVENVMLQHPAVADIAVIGVANEHWGEVPVGVYRAMPNIAPDAADLEAFGRTSLASFKVPRRWVEVQEFPLTASGKIKKRELRALLDVETQGR
jgi:fatty-acyl-CoA synthase